jgi:hypothetical protein
MALKKYLFLVWPLFFELPSMAFKRTFIPSMAFRPFSALNGVNLRVKRP